MDPVRVRFARDLKEAPLKGAPVGDREPGTSRSSSVRRGIVPKSATSDGNRTTRTGCLPYEGDRMLTVILSKAMLLAKDTEITDRRSSATCDQGL